MFGYRYYVLVSVGFPRESPSALFRVRKDAPAAAGIEGFTPGVGWERSERVTFELVKNISAPISVWEVKRYKKLLAQREVDIEKKGYQYYFISPDGFPTEQPVALIRKLDTGHTASGEEFFTRYLKWERSDRLYRIESGRDYDEAMPISEAEAMAYVDRVTRKVQAGED
jgi:hypothetical protein